MPDRVTDDAAASDHWEDALIILQAALVTITTTTLFCVLPAMAEIRVVTSQGHGKGGGGRGGGGRGR